MLEEIRFALIGAGSVAQNYAQAFKDCAEAKLVAVVDTNESSASAMAELFGCSSYNSFETLHNSATGFDAAIICTPPDTHEEIVVRLAERGKHVLCEKPFALEGSGARRMIEAARRSGITLTMGSKFRYVDDVIRAKSIVESGVLGDVVLYENAFTSKVNMATRWNCDPKVAGGGVLIDNGSHSVDIMRFFLGPLSSVQVVEGKRIQGLAVEDTALMLARSEGGVVGRIDLSWSLNKESEFFLNIFGSDGTVSVGWKGSRYRQSSNPSWVEFGRGYEKIQAFRGQLRNFANAILGREPLLITADDALASVEVITTAYESMRRQRWMAVGELRGGER